MNKRQVVLPIFSAAGVSPRVIQAIGAGIEEEGVPYRHDERPSETNAGRLGAMAADFSPLGVGIGVGSGDELAVHHEKDPENPYLKGHSGIGRLIGHNAARLVKGLPLKTE